jgi:plasmid stabilization system protein ParE
VSSAVCVRPEARNDIEQAAAWYERQRKGPGEAFLDEVLDTFDRIAEDPRLYPVMHRQTRRAVVHRFPFGVFYQIEEDAVVVLAVIHGSRDPRAWQQRS